VVQYDGTDFYGSQIQPGKRTVQGVLADTLRELLGVGVRLLFASRTDRGVHATHNVCTFKIKNLPIDTAKLPDVLNSRLDQDIRVVKAMLVSNSFHPRYMATRRDYTYRIFLSRRDDIRYIRFSHRVGEELDIATMRLCAGLFPGERDFTPFAVGLSEIKDPICNLYQLKILQKGRFLIIRLSANRFLRKMACKIVGTLIEVGRAKLGVLTVERALRDGVRPEPAFPEAPAKGLTLSAVHYPDELLFADR